MIQHHQHLPLVTVSETDHASEAFAKMEKYGISQLPVQNDAGDFVGSLNDTHVMSLLLKDSTVRTKSVRDIMQKPFPQVDYHQSLEDVTKLINQDNPAVLVNDLIGIPHILTKNDIIAALAR